ncbi:MAG: TetR/AcrR family transcriptional regulator [Desulfohalobiaceae bacterium]
MSQDQIENRILQAAQAEFARNGFHKTVVSDIALRAGVGKGTVYRRFGNKEALFNTLTTWAMRLLEEQIVQACSRSQSPSQTLQEIMDIHFSFFQHSRQIVEIVVMEGMQISGLFREELAAEVIRVKDRFRELFIQGMQQGEFKQLDPERLAFLFQSFIWSMLKSAILYNIENPGQIYGPLMLEIFLQGISSHAPESGLKPGE